LVARRHVPRARFGLCVFVLGFIVPFVIVGLSPIKEVRYYYPAQVNLVVLAGLLLSTLSLTALRRMALAALFIVPLVKVSIGNGVVSLDDPCALSSFSARAPDSNSHQLDIVVKDIARVAGEADSHVA